MEAGLVSSVVALGVAMAAVATDTRSGLIPNRLTFPAIAGGLAFHSWVNGWGGLGFSAQGAALGLALLGLPFLLGGMGAGDVKLLAALGALVGPLAIFHTFIFAALGGGGIGLFVILHRYGPWSLVGLVAGGWQQLCTPEFRITRMTSFPFASAMFFGLFAALVMGGPA